MSLIDDEPLIIIKKHVYDNLIRENKKLKINELELIDNYNKLSLQVTNLTEQTESNNNIIKNLQECNKFPTERIINLEDDSSYDNIIKKLDYKNSKSQIFDLLYELSIICNYKKSNNKLFVKIGDKLEKNKMTYFKVNNINKNNNDGADIIDWKKQRLLYKFQNLLPKLKNDINDELNYIIDDDKKYPIFDLIFDDLNNSITNRYGDCPDDKISQYDELLDKI
jgi:hypothetical protein